MMRRISTRLEIKLFLMVMMVIMLAIIPVAYTFWQVVSAYGRIASEIDEKQVVFSLESDIRELTRSRVLGYQAFFDRIAGCVSILGRQAELLYSRLDFYAENPLKRHTYQKRSEDGFWVSSAGEPVISLYRGNNDMPGTVTDELRALSHIEPLLAQMVAGNRDIPTGYVIGFNSNDAYTAVYAGAVGELSTVSSPAVFDLRDGKPGMIFSDKQEGGSREVLWKSVYTDETEKGLMLKAYAPIYGRNETLRGIAGIDVSLKAIVDDIQHDCYPGTNDRDDFAFLVDETGRLIVFPDRQLRTFGLPAGEDPSLRSAASGDISLLDSTRAEVRSFAAAIRRSESFSSTLTINEKVYYVATRKLKNPGWIYGLVAERPVISAPFLEKQAVFTNRISDIGLQGMLWGLASIFFVLIVVFASVRYFLMPLRALVVVTRRAADGDLDVRCPVTTGDEIGGLAISFNTMVERLQRVLDRQKRYADSLEIEVQRRSRELIDKQRELEKEIERRQLVSEALRASRQQYDETMEVTRVGIYILTDDILAYANTPLAEMVRLTAEEMIGTDLFDYIVTEDRAVVEKNIRRLLQGGDVSPYRVQCLRSDGTRFFGELWARVTKWQEKLVIIGTVTDVSNLKLSEERIEAQDVQLRKSLAEKEILLKEIYHRTKNNMLVIISMLELQTRDIEDTKVKQIVAETESRIRSMALVHEKLYHSQNLSEIDIGSYLEEVAEVLVANMVLTGKIRLDIEVAPVAINIDYAVPIGLVINEIITNAVKHAFPDDRCGRVFV
ncbi:MAG: hypothetical protein CR981_03135, partial [Proteobacteria bacterium]